MLLQRDSALFRFTVRVTRGAALASDDSLRDAIWALWEENMRRMYVTVRRGASMPVPFLILLLRTQGRTVFVRLEPL